MKEHSQLFTSNRMSEEKEIIPSITNNTIKIINNQNNFASKSKKLIKKNNDIISELKMKIRELDDCFSFYKKQNLKKKEGISNIVSKSRNNTTLKQRTLDFSKKQKKFSNNQLSNNANIDSILNTNRHSWITEINIKNNERKEKKILLNESVGEKSEPQKKCFIKYEYRKNEYNSQEMINMNKNNSITKNFSKSDERIRRIKKHEFNQLINDINSIMEPKNETINKKKLTKENQLYMLSKPNGISVYKSKTFYIPKKYDYIIKKKINKKMNCIEKEYYNKKAKIFRKRKKTAHEKVLENMTHFEELSEQYKALNISPENIYLMKNIFCDKFGYILRENRNELYFDDFYKKDYINRRKWFENNKIRINNKLKILSFLKGRIICKKDKLVQNDANKSDFYFDNESYYNDKNFIGNYDSYRNKKIWQ